VGWRDMTEKMRVKNWRNCFFFFLSKQDMIAVMDKETRDGRMNGQTTKTTHKMIG